ncbi:hypothetical protein [Actinopolymorpha cephalotaxi]|nr:hypothetical protein [Actinopolymorpha cephalotaxi]
MTQTQVPKKKSKLWALIVGISVIVGIAASVLGVWGAIPHPPPSISGSIGDRASSDRFLNFLDQHRDSTVFLDDVTCPDPEGPGTGGSVCTPGDKDMTIDLEGNGSVVVYMDTAGSEATLQRDRFYNLIIHGNFHVSEPNTTSMYTTTYSLRGK